MLFVQLFDTKVWQITTQCVQSRLHAASFTLCVRQLSSVSVHEPCSSAHRESHSLHTRPMSLWVSLHTGKNAKMCRSASGHSMSILSTWQKKNVWCKAMSLVWTLVVERRPMQLCGLWASRSRGFYSRHGVWARVVLRMWWQAVRSYVLRRDGRTTGPQRRPQPHW